MGRFFLSEAPSFSLFHGRIKFSVDECPRLRHEAIERACRRHGVPNSISKLYCSDPWERVILLGEQCRLQGISLNLNSTTIIGNSIADGNKAELWQKVMPVLFEMVCLEIWRQAWEVNSRDYDARIDLKRVDWKYKHRNVVPKNAPSRGQEYIATVPVSQRNQKVDFYCFGQISAKHNQHQSWGMKDGYINGVMSKEEFTKKCKTKRSGQVDSNGEKYVDPVDYVTISQLHTWHDETLAGFFPLGCV